MSDGVPVRAPGRGEKVDAPFDARTLLVLFLRALSVFNETDARRPLLRHFSQLSLAVAKSPARPLPLERVREPEHVHGEEETHRRDHKLRRDLPPDLPRDGPPRPTGPVLAFGRIRTRDARTPGVRTPLPPPSPSLPSSSSAAFTYPFPAASAARRNASSASSLSRAISFRLSIRRASVGAATSANAIFSPLSLQNRWTCLNFSSVRMTLASPRYRSTAWKSFATAATASRTADSAKSSWNSSSSTSFARNALSSNALRLSR